MTTPQPNWLTGQDMTTIATGRPAVPDSPSTAVADDTTPARPRLAAGPTAALTFLSAVWLAMASIRFYQLYEQLWTDVVIGAAIAAVSLARVAKPMETRSLAWVNIVLGAWLVAEPFAWGYNTALGAAPVVWNDLAVGLAVVFLSALGLTGTGRRPSRP